ncbi:MAG: FAD-dependent oxidoreductase [Blastochloris sp.]|nr:FAD-dependent oxidoreductase [Blastochloris sp.]
MEELLPKALECYAALERESGLRLWEGREILRYFQSEEERRRWEKKAGNAEVQAFTKTLRAGEKEGPLAGVNTHGGICIRGGGRVDLGSWLAWWRESVQEGKCMEEVEFREEDLTLLEKGLRWRGRSFERVYFCSGYARWKLWDWLPWKAAKGEFLTLEMPGLELSSIIKKGIFIIPWGERKVRIGATYVWNPLDGEPTEEAREGLLNDFRRLLPPGIQEGRVLEQRAGVRPILKGNRPMLGCHPRHEQLVLCNGLGSKGALQAPWAVEHLVEHLEEGRPLDAEVDVAGNI